VCRSLTHLYLCAEQRDAALHNLPRGRWLKALAEDPHLRAGLNIHEGHICAELKIEPRVAREKLRAAIREPKKYPNLAKAHKPRQPWQWAKGSPAEKEARSALSA